MVRVKAKARKGDAAFEQRKQKVGRKKLAPATATRAEVHARTLRLTAPSAITRATLEEPPTIRNEQGNRKYQREEEEEEKKKKRDKATVVVSAEQLHRDFKEHLCGARHYKKSVRASAFTSLTRSITANYETLKLAISQSSPFTVSSAARRVDELLLSPVELLYAFTSALDAMTDTDDDVRRAALNMLRVILHPPCEYPQNRGSVNDLNILDKHTIAGGGDNDNNDVVNLNSAMACDMERIRAVMRAVDVTLTHAMVSVRRTGVELLQLILQVCPSGVRTVLSESDEWVKMVIRVSNIVMHNTGSGSNSSNTVITTAMKMIQVIPDMLETMLQPCTSIELSNNNNNGVSSVENNDIDNEQQQREAVLMEIGTAPVRILELFEECSPKWSMAWKELMELQAALFRDVERVHRATAIARVFACLSMFLRKYGLLKKQHLQLLRQLFTAKVPFTMRELVATAAVATSETVHSPKSNTTSGNNNNSNNSSSNSTNTNTTTVIMSSGSKSRLELANAIADACLPLAASSDDAWQMLRDFLSFTIRDGKDTTTSNTNNNNNNNNNNTRVNYHNSGISSRNALRMLGPLHTLRAAVVQFPSSLLPRLLFLAPPLLQSVTRAASHNINNNNNNNNNNNTEETTWVKVLLATADVLSVLLASQAAAASQQGLKFLSEAVLSVPRLLFALRTNTDHALVNRVVFAFLLPLWRAASSGHPLLISIPSSSSVSSAALQLRAMLPSLFELRMPAKEKCDESVVLDGVLCCCERRTVELAVHLLFYLNGEVPRTCAACVRTGAVFPDLAITLPCA